MSSVQGAAEIAMLKLVVRTVNVQVCESKFQILHSETQFPFYSLVHFESLAYTDTE